jgi:hypothetical protein
MAIDTKSMMKADKKLAQGAIKSAKALLSDLSKTQKAIDRAMIAENKRDKRIAQDTVKSAKAYLKNLNSGFDNAGALLTIKIEGNCSKFHSTDVPHVIAESEESKLQKPSRAVMNLLNKMNVELDDIITSLPDGFVSNTSHRMTVLRRKFIHSKMIEGVLTWRMLLCGGIKYMYPNKGIVTYKVCDWNYDTAPEVKKVNKVKSNVKSNVNVNKKEGMVRMLIAKFEPSQRASV